MSSLQHFQDQSFWPWAITLEDVDAARQQAIVLYRRRFNQEPFLLFCHQDVNLRPVPGLRIEQHDFLPPGLFYFARNRQD